MRDGRGDARGYGWLATAGGALLLLVAGFVVGLLTGSLFEEPDLVARQLSGEATELPLPPAATGAAAPAPATAPTDATAAPADAGAAGGGAPADFDAGSDDERAPAPAPAPAAASPSAPRAETGARVPESPDVEAAVEAPPPSAPAPAAQPPAPVVAAAPPAAPPSPPPRVEPPAVSSRGPGFAVQVGAFSERAAADRLVGSLRGDRFAAYVVEGAPGEGARFRVRVGPYATRDEASGQAARLKQRRKLPTWVIREDGP